MRNDASLYSGANSQSYVQEKKQVRTQKKLEQLQAISKDATFVYDIIDKHKASLGQKLLDLTDENSDDNKVKDTLNAIRLHKEFISDLEGKLKQVLRAKPKPQKEQSND